MTDKKEEKKEKKREHSAIKELISWIEVFAAAIIAALFINSFIIANSTVPAVQWKTPLSKRTE